MIVGMELEALITLLGLQPHPEGGWYAETFRSSERVVRSDGVERSALTAIDFVLRAGDVSALHRVCSDELWHHQGGNPIELVTVDPLGAVSRVLLGNDLASGMRTHHAVPAGWWQAARSLGMTGYSLAACSVAPGFEFEDFTMPAGEELLKIFPSLRELILEFTRPRETRML